MGVYVVLNEGHKIFANNTEITGYTKIESISTELNELYTDSSIDNSATPVYGDWLSIDFNFIGSVTVDSIDLTYNGKIFSTTYLPKDRKIFPREMIIFLMEYYKILFNIGYIINIINEDNTEEKIIGVPDA